MTIFIKFVEPTVSQSIAGGIVCGILSQPLSLAIDNYQTSSPLIVEYHWTTIALATLAIIAIVILHSVCASSTLSAFLFSASLFLPLIIILSISSFVHWFKLFCQGQRAKFSLRFWFRQFIRGALGIVPVLALYFCTI